MVIWFNNEKARLFLLSNRYVFTLRPKERKEGVEPLFWDEFKKKGEVSVDFVKYIINSEDLNKYVNGSGFSSIKHWLKEANGNRFLYYVRLLKIIENINETVII